MIERRAVAFAPGDVWALFLRRDRPLHYLMERHLDPLMADSHTPVNQFLNHDPLRTDGLLYLIERPLMLYRVVILQGPFRLDTKNGTELKVFDRAVQVLFLLRRNAKAPVIDREIGSEESVRVWYRAHAPQPHLLDHTVLERVEEALDPSFGLGRMGMEHLDAQFL